MKQFVALDNEERRMLLRTLSDEQYQDVLNVCISFPYLEIGVKTKVLDDEDMHLVTSGSIVTAIVILTRKSLGDLVDSEEALSAELLLDDDNLADEATSPDSPKPVKGWQRKVKKGKGAKKPVKKQPVSKKQLALKKKEEEDKKLEEEKKEKEKSSKKKSKSSKKENIDTAGDSDYEFSGVDEVDDDGSAGDDEKEENSDAEDSGNNAEDEWETIKDDELIQPEKLLEVKSKESHIVHCPYYPMEKHEYWWVYIVSKKTNELLTPPQQVTSLKDEEEVQLKFTAPTKPGKYQYTVVVRSDSYVDFDSYQYFKVNVSEAKEFDPGAHWDCSSDEEDKDESGESVYETEDEEDQDDENDSAEESE